MIVCKECGNPAMERRVYCSVCLPLGATLPHPPITPALSITAQQESKLSELLHKLFGVILPRDSARALLEEILRA